MQEFNSQPDENIKKNTPNIWGILIPVVIFFIVFIMILIFTGGDGSSSRIMSPITYENYVKLQEDMTYDQVVEIFGGQQGELDTSSSYGGYTMTIYSWSNASTTKIVTVSFMNGKVSAYSQIGL